MLAKPAVLSCGSWVVSGRQLGWRLLVARGSEPPKAAVASSAFRVPRSSRRELAVSFKSQVAREPLRVHLSLKLNIANYPGECYN